MYALTKISGKLFEQQIINSWKEQRTGSGGGEDTCYMLHKEVLKDKVLRFFYQLKKTNPLLISILFLDMQLILLAE